MQWFSEICAYQLTDERNHHKRGWHALPVFSLGGTQHGCFWLLLESKNGYPNQSYQNQSYQHQSY